MTGGAGGRAEPAADAAADAAAAGAPTATAAELPVANEEGAMSGFTVQHVAERSRFEVRSGERPAGFVAYRSRPGVITFTHTEIEHAFEGRGVGSTLVRAALDDARRRHLAVVPACPFVRAYIERHPDYADLVADEAR